MISQNNSNVHVETSIGTSVPVRAAVPIVSKVPRPKPIHRNHALIVLLDVFFFFYKQWKYYVSLPIDYFPPYVFSS